jgi:hypothetical protein
MPVWLFVNRERDFLLDCLILAGPWNVFPVWIVCNWTDFFGEKITQGFALG